MLKREITYEDFNGETVTEVFYFNIAKPELVELEVEVEGGFSTWIQGIIDANDKRVLIEQFKRLVLMAYGQKSEDGKRFIKSPELSKEFSQTNAYNVLFMELATDDSVAASFIMGVLPKDMAAQVASGTAAVSTPSV